MISFIDHTNAVHHVNVNYIVVAICIIYVNTLFVISNDCYVYHRLSSCVLLSQKAPEEEVLWLLPVDGLTGPADGPHNAPTSCLLRSLPLLCVHVRPRARDLPGYGTLVNPSGSVGGILYLLCQPLNYHMKLPR